MKLSVIMPVYNEEKTVRKILEKLIKVKEVFEIIIVNDGSTDRSLAEIKKVKDKRIRVFSKGNEGKGSAIRLGLSKAKGDYVLIQDADLEYDPADITSLLKVVKESKAEVVYGSRFLGPHLNLLFWHRVGNSLLNLVVNLLFNTTLSDMEVGYKLIPAEIMRDLKLEASGFEIEPEITCKLLKRGYKIFEVPISYVGRDFSAGKKINWKDGVIALGRIIKEKLKRT